MVLIRKCEIRGGVWNNFPKFVKRKASLHCVSLTIKKNYRLEIVVFSWVNGVYYIRHSISSVFSTKSRNICLKIVLKMLKKPYFCWLKSGFWEFLVHKIRFFSVWVCWKCHSCALSMFCIVKQSKKSKKNFRKNV